jgi:hypothetical protein
MTATKTGRILHLVTDPSVATVTPLEQPAKPAPNFTPVIDPIRDAAIEAALDPDVLHDMDDTIQTALTRMHRDNGATPLAGLLIDVWRTAFTVGYQAAYTDQAHADFADDTLAEVVHIEAGERKALRETEYAIKRKAAKK